MAIIRLEEGRIHVHLALWQHFNTYFKNMSGLASKKLEVVMALICVAMEICPVESYLSLAGSGHLKTGT